jgi:hypothetical protein
LHSVQYVAFACFVTTDKQDKHTWARQTASAGWRGIERMHHGINTRKASTITPPFSAVRPVFIRSRSLQQRRRYVAQGDDVRCYLRRDGKTREAAARRVAPSASYSS